MKCFMILIFDLDDTLYRELDFVEGGFRNVAGLLEEELGLSSERTYRRLVKLLNDNGRGRVFDMFLLEQGIYSKERLMECVSRYRYGPRSLSLSDTNKKLLRELKTKFTMYVVTDGNKSVQKFKADLLGLHLYFERVLPTHSFGKNRAKPSIYCFQKIAEWERVPMSELIYIGDNPEKDFVGLKSAGGKTVRLLEGPYQNMSAKPGHEADYTIASLPLVRKILEGLTMGGPI
jgi:putative hydrolase of the HAD superfamily